MLGLATSVPHMYVGHRKTVRYPRNASGFVRQDAYICGPVTNCSVGYVYTIEIQTSRFPKHCTSQNAISAEFLQLQIPPRVPVMLGSVGVKR